MCTRFWVFYYILAIHQSYKAEYISHYMILVTSLLIKEFKIYVLRLDNTGAVGVNLTLGSIQCFIVDSIAPESPNSKSARCQALTLGEIELSYVLRKKS